MALSLERFELVDDAAELPFVVLVTVDLQNATITLFRSGGKSATVPIEMPSSPEISRIKRLQWAPCLDGLIAETTLGDEVAFEMPRIEETDQLAGRLVVYLDQNMWSMVANAHHDPSRVPNADDVPARFNSRRGSQSGRSFSRYHPDITARQPSGGMNARAIGWA
jgi:hypothetical protein